MITSICTIGTSHSVRDVGPVQSEATQKKMLLKSGTGGLTMVDLKPCPFCGGKARLFVNGGVRVICSKCYVGTMILTDNMEYESNAVETVIEAWNRRASNNG